MPHQQPNAGFKNAIYQDHALSTLSPQTLITDPSDSPSKRHSTIDHGRESVELTWRQRRLSPGVVTACPADEYNGIMIEEQNMPVGASAMMNQQVLQQVQHQGYEQQVPMPDQIITIATNAESDGIFDYYRRSMSEVMTNKHHGTSSVQYGNHQAGHNNRAVANSHISALVYSQSTVAPQNTTSSYIAPEIQQHGRSSICENSAMLDNTLLADKMAENGSIQTSYMPQDLSRLTNYDAYGHGGGVLNTGTAVLHSQSMGHQAAGGLKNQTTGLKPPTFHNAYVNLNFKENSMMSPVEQRRRYDGTQRINQRLLSPELPLTDHHLAKEQRRKARNRSSNYRPSASMKPSHQLSAQLKQHNQSQHKIVSRNNIAIPSVQELLPATQITSEYGVEQDLQQQQLTFSQRAVINEREMFQQQNQQNNLSSRPLSMSLLSSSNQNSMQLSHPLQTSHITDFKLPQQVNLDQTRTTRAGTECLQQSILMSQQNNNNQLGSFGGNNEFLAQQQHPQMMMMVARQPGNEYLNATSGFTMQQQQQQQSNREQPILGAKNQFIHKDTTRHRSLDPNVQVLHSDIYSNHEGYAGYQHPQQQQPQQLPQMMRAAQTIEPVNSGTTLYNTEFCEPPMSAGGNVVPYSDNMTIQTGSNNVLSSPAPYQFAQLQQEKSCLAQEVSNLQVLVTSLTQHKAKLRKSKKKLRQQLDSVKTKIQMHEMSRTEVTQTNLDNVSENCHSDIILPPSTKTNNIYLVQAIHDLKTKLKDIQGATSTNNNNEFQMHSLQNTMDALCKNLLSNSQPIITDNTGQSKAHLMNTQLFSDMQYNNSQTQHHQLQNPSRQSLQTEEPSNMATVVGLDAMAPGYHHREHLTTEEFDKHDSTSHLHQYAAPAREVDYQIVMSSSPQLSQTNHTSDTGTAVEEQLDPIKVVRAFSSSRAKSGRAPLSGVVKKQSVNAGTQTNAEGHKAFESLKAETKKQTESVRAEVDRLIDENTELKERLCETETQLEEQRVEKEKEVSEILQKYQEAVKKMQSRLKQVAMKFDEGEKSRQARLRKARKEIEHELCRLTEMNESLFTACQQIQEKLLVQVEHSNEFQMEKTELQAEMDDLIDERRRQGAHLIQLLSINKGQAALIESFKRRLIHAETSGRGSFTNEIKRQMRRSKSSSVQLVASTARLVDQFESGVKLLPEIINSPKEERPYGDNSNMPNDLHERSEVKDTSMSRDFRRSVVGGTQFSPGGGNQTLGTDAAHQRLSMPLELDTGYLQDVKTYDSQLLRRSLLDANKSTINHDSHHDQHDYDSEVRRELINSIPQMSPFLLGQLTHRLELQSKVLDHKLYIEKHRKEQKKPHHRQSVDTAAGVPTDHQLQLQGLLTATSAAAESAEVMFTPTNAQNQTQQQHNRQGNKMAQKKQGGAENKNKNLDQAAGDKTMNNGHQDMKRTPTSTDPRNSSAIQIYLAPCSSSEQLEGVPGRNDNNHATTVSSSAEGGDSRDKQLTVSFRQQDSQRQQIQDDQHKFLNEILFSNRPDNKESKYKRSLKQEPQVVEACSQYASMKHIKEDPSCEAYDTQNRHPKTMQKEFWKLQQLVSLDSSILTEAQQQQSINSSAMREKHQRMSQDFEKLQGSQEVLLTKIKDEIGSLDHEIIVLQQNLSKAIVSRLQ